MSAVNHLDWLLTVISRLLTVVVSRPLLLQRRVLLCHPPCSLLPALCIPPPHLRSSRDDLQEASIHQCQILSLTPTPLPPPLLQCCQVAEISAKKLKRGRGEKKSWPEEFVAEFWANFTKSAERNLRIFYKKSSLFTGTDTLSETKKNLNINLN
jgi:hypothetical protein